MFLSLVGRLLRRRLRGAPSRAESLDEATQQYLAKEAKLEVATDAVLVDDMRKLAEDERETVGRYREKKLFRGNGAPRRKRDDRMGDFIVCDDYRKGLGPLGTTLVALATVAGITASVLGLGMLRQPEQPPAAEDTDTTRRSTIEPYTPD